jgi:hypothetical protein
VEIAFDRIPTNDLWLDFTALTPVETMISAIEEVLRQFMTQFCDDRIVQSLVTLSSSNSFQKTHSNQHNFPADWSCLIPLLRLFTAFSHVRLHLSL